MNILITGGGTGGHLYPALELAKHYKKLGNNVFYIASKNGIDKEIIDSQDDLSEVDIQYWDLKGIRRDISISSLVNNLQTGIKLLTLFGKSKRYLKSNNIDVVIGVGGYISYPVVKVAADMKIPTLIHEQNSYPGLANRKLAKKVDKVLVAYIEAQKYFGVDVVEVSNPRVDITQNYLNKKYHNELSLNSQKEIVLFLGGSLGADTINNLFLELIKADKENKYQCVLISGLLNNDINKENLKDSIVLENTNELLKYMATADYIISRAGATTLLEIVYLEKKSIIIPSPNVVANHQYYNGLDFYNNHMIYMIEEQDMNFNDFLKEFEKLKNDDEIISNLRKYDKILSLDLFDEILKEIYDN